MRIDILTVVPELLESPLNHSIVQRAKNKGLVEIHIHDIRDYGKGNYRQVDDYSYGGDAGMILMIEPIYTLINKLKEERNYDEIIYMSPDGNVLDQPIANRLSCMENIMILCGHYKGIDHRIREHLITKEISIGDYVLTGGELAAAVITDSLVRLIPGVLSDPECFQDESHWDGLLEYPQYSRPEVWHGRSVPKELLTGDHKGVLRWRRKEQLRRTMERRPDMFEKLQLSDKNDLKLLEQVKR